MVALARLDPTQGSEIRKTRPCVVISPDEMNGALRTVVVAPMTTQGRDHPWRGRVRFDGKDGRIALDQIRTVDQQRIVRRQGRIDADAAGHLLDTLSEMFAP